MNRHTRNRLLDTQDGAEAVALIDAQAAVIARVRARYNAMPAMWNFEALKRFARETMADIEQWPSDDEALAAAPEHTAPDTQLKVERDALVEAVERRDHGIADLRGMIAAANARVSELERQNSQLITQLHEAGARIDAANDRADAAERRASDEERWARLESSRADIAEVHERELRALQLTHEAEAAALRTRVAELEESEARAVARAKDIEAECVRVERRVIAANARVAERDRTIEQLDQLATLFQEGEHAANARADAAERDNENLRQTIANDVRAIAAESEAAALRAELKRLKARP